MAAPTYTTDLVDLIADSDITAWGELTTMTAGGAPDEADTESALQGTNSVSQITNTTLLFSMCRILTSPVTLNTNDVFLVWHCHSVATALLDYASGGLRLFVANTLANWKGWAVGGNDVAPYPYGNWINNPIDPTIAYEYSNGTPPTGLSFYGVGSGGILSQVVARGQPHKVDIIRYGRAEARINGGETGNYATFSGFAAVNDYNDAVNGYNRWGLIQATTGGYLWKGLMILGYSSAVDFRDSNKNILVQDTRKVYSTFNKIEIRQAASRVDWTGISFTCLSPATTASKGNLEVVDNADVNIDACTFTDMGAFSFQSGTTILTSTFRRCGLVAQNSATLTGCTFDKTDDTVKALLCNNPALISDCTFNSGGTKHALEISTPGTYTFSGNTFSGYGASGTADAAIYNNSGGSVTLNITGGGDTTPTVRNGGGATTTIVAAVDLTITVVDKNNSPVPNAQTAIYLSSDDSVLMNQDTDINGGASASFSGSTPANIYVRVRKSSTGSTKYYPASTTGTITTAGLNTTITLIEDNTA